MNIRNPEFWYWLLILALTGILAALIIGTRADANILAREAYTQCLRLRIPERSVYFQRCMIYQYHFQEMRAQMANRLCHDTSNQLAIEKRCHADYTRPGLKPFIQIDQCENRQLRRCILRQLQKTAPSNK
ncbi:hypothetical protein ACJU26_08755 [Acidithiobacillus sp. M4-SHS-6]|uniref:hypothetical protein n=1 Tax=Acidithiobacillus sp. M4-SHS-6 TaxID=3383024 RepID=UPI0039BEAACF